MSFYYFQWTFYFSTPFRNRLWPSFPFGTAKVLTFSYPPNFFLTFFWKNFSNSSPLQYPALLTSRLRSAKVETLFQSPKKTSFYVKINSIPIFIYKKKYTGRKKMLSLRPMKMNGHILPFKSNLDVRRRRCASYSLVRI